MRSQIGSPSTRSRLLSEAKRLLAERGFARTTIRDIGQAADINPTAIRYHFGSKRALIEAVLDDAAAVARTYLLQPVQEMGATQQIESMLRGAYELAADNPDIVRLAFQSLAHGLQYSPGMRTLFNTAAGRIQTAIERGQEHGIVRMTPSHLLAANVVAQVVVLCVSSVRESQIAPLGQGHESRRAMVGSVIEFVKAGVAAPAKLPDQGANELKQTSES